VPRHTAVVVRGTFVMPRCRAERTAEVAQEAVAAGARRCGADARRRRAFRLPCVRATGQHRGEVGETTELRSRMPCPAATERTKPERTEEAGEQAIFFY